MKNSGYFTRRIAGTLHEDQLLIISLYTLILLRMKNVLDKFRLISFTNFNAQSLYSLTICTLHYNPRHVSSINMPIFRRTNFIITASGIVTLCKRLAQHVSGTIMSIIRSSRVLYSWLPPVVFGAWFSSCQYGVELRVVCPVCGLLQQPANRTHKPKSDDF
jgi:hypothetical protein